MNIHIFRYIALLSRYEHNATHHHAWIFSNTAVRTSDVAQLETDTNAIQNWSKIQQLQILFTLCHALTFTLAAYLTSRRTEPTELLYWHRPNCHPSPQAKQMISLFTLLGDGNKPSTQYLHQPRWPQQVISILAPSYNCWDTQYGWAPGASYVSLASYPYTSLDRPLGLQKVQVPRISRQFAHDGGKVASPRARVWPERLTEWNISMTPSRIKLAAFRLVAQCLN